MIKYVAFVKKNNVMTENHFSACHVARAWEWLRILSRDGEIDEVVMLINLDTQTVVKE